MKGSKGVAKVTVECVYHVIRWYLSSHVSAALSSIGIGIAAIPHHGGGCDSGSGSARSLTTGAIDTSSHGSGISLRAYDTTPSLSVSPTTFVLHYHTSNLSQLSLAFPSDMKGTYSSNNSYSANLNINSNVANGKNNKSINSMNNGFEIFDLPKKLISSYIFSYSDIESFCVIGRNPSSYHNSVFSILTRMMNGHKSLFHYSYCKTVCIMLNICLLFDKVAINRYLIPQIYILNFQLNIECFTLYNLFPSSNFCQFFIS